MMGREIELTEKDLGYFSKFGEITRVMPSDYVISGDLIVFLVDPFKLGKAIGKNAINIKKMNKIFGKKVVIVPDSDDIEAFLRSFFMNINILDIDIREAMGERLATVIVDEKDRGIAIGKGGDRIKALKELLKRKFNATLKLKTRRVI